MNIENLKEFGLEVTLKVLKKTDDEIKKYRALDDYEGVKTLESDVLSKYEKLYQGFSSDEFNSLSADSFKELESLLVDILIKNNLDLKYIKKEIENRKKYRGNSGREAVKNLYTFQVKELKEKLEVLLSEADTILNTEAKLEEELREAIQEEEELKIIEKMPEVRSRYSKLAKKIDLIQEKIVYLESIINKGWPLDIYGTISKDQLLEVFKKEVN